MKTCIREYTVWDHFCHDECEKTGLSIGSKGCSECKYFVRIIEQRECKDTIYKHKAVGRVECKFINTFKKAEHWVCKECGRKIFKSKMPETCSCQKRKKPQKQAF